MTRLNKRTIFFALLILSQVFLYGLRWQKSNVMTSDFVYFYVVGRLYESGQNPYDLDRQCRAQAELRPGDCAGYAHTPILLPLLALLFNDDFRVSYWRWSLFQLGLLAICVWLLNLVSRNFFASLQCCVFPPVIGGLLIANDTIFILTAILGWAVLMLRKADLWAGIVLALVILKPQLALPLAIPLLFVRPKAFAGFCIGAGVLTLYSLLIVGIDGFVGIIEVTRSLARGGTFGGVSHSIMFNTSGILARLGINTLWAWPLYAAGIAGLSIYLRKHGITLSSISLAVLITVVICPHLFAYDLSYLVLPLIVVHPLGVFIGSLVTGLLLIGSPWWTVYLMMIVVGYLLLKQKPGATTTAGQTSRISSSVE